MKLHVRRRKRGVCGFCKGRSTSLFRLSLLAFRRALCLFGGSLAVNFNPFVGTLLRLLRLLLFRLRHVVLLHQTHTVLQREGAHSKCNRERCLGPRLRLQQACHAVRRQQSKRRHLCGRKAFPAENHGWFDKPQPFANNVRHQVTPKGGVHPLCRTQHSCAHNHGAVSLPAAGHPRKQQHRCHRAKEGEPSCLPAPACPTHTEQECTHERQRGGEEHRVQQRSAAPQHPPQHKEVQRRARQTRLFPRQQLRPRRPGHGSDERRNEVHRQTRDVREGRVRPGVGHRVPHDEGEGCSAGGDGNACAGAELLALRARRTAGVVLILLILPVALVVLAVEEGNLDAQPVERRQRRHRDNRPRRERPHPQRRVVRVVDRPEFCDEHRQHRRRQPQRSRVVDGARDLEQHREPQPAQRPHHGVQPARQLRALEPCEQQTRADEKCLQPCRSGGGGGARQAVAQLHAARSKEKEKRGKEPSVGDGAGIPAGGEEQHNAQKRGTLQAVGNRHPPHRPAGLATPADFVHSRSALRKAQHARQRHSQGEQRVATDQQAAGRNAQTVRAEEGRALLNPMLAHHRTGGGGGGLQ
eukprot:Rhum_TRINITY_DN15154_c2_g9::Rhum_TRINITY_DN15154_c2_g9_i3::g.140982::m.140982